MIKNNEHKRIRQKSKNFDNKLLKIKLKESKEGFLYVPELIKQSKVDIKVRDSKNFYLRIVVALNLIKASEYFNKKGYILCIESSYRSIDEQKTRFKKRFNELKKSFPKKTNEELLNRANIYTAGIPIFASHIAGASVDVLLQNKAGKLLFFGAHYPKGDIESVTNYPHLSKIAKINRKILKNGMERHGFVNYPFEYWHYSIGDVCAAHILKQKYAKYGPVNYDFKNKKYFFEKDKKELYSYFKVD